MNITVQTSEHSSRRIMKEMSITVTVGGNESYQTAFVDEDGYARIITGYVLEGYKVKLDPNEDGAIIASNRTAHHIIRLGE